MKAHQAYPAFDSEADDAMLQRCFAIHQARRAVPQFWSDGIDGFVVPSPAVKSSYVWILQLPTDTKVLRLPIKNARLLEGNACRKLNFVSARDVTLTHDEKSLHLPSCTCGVKFTGGIHSDWCDTK
jgi:hypothetical protein